MYTIRLEINGRVHYFKTESCLSAFLAHQAFCIDPCNYNSLIFVYQGTREILKTVIKNGEINITTED